MSKLKEQFGAQWQLAFVTFMLRDSDFLGRVADDVRDDYFLDDTLSRIVKIILAFYATHNSAPDTLIYNELDQMRQSNRISAENVTTINAYLDELYGTQLQNREYLLSNFDTYIRQAKIQRYLPEFVEYSQEGKWEEAEKLMKDLLASTRSLALTAYDFTDDVESRISRRNQEDKFSLTHIPELDEYVQVRRGQVNAVQSRASSDGKTAFLVHLCRYYLYCKKKVLLVTLEEPIESYEDRLDQCLCFMTRDEIKNPDNAHLMHAGINRYITRGQLKIQCLPPAKTRVSDIDNLIESLVSCDNFVPDVLILDYADRCAPETPSLRGNVAEAHGEIYSYLEAMAQQRNLFLWTAFQSNRKALEDKALAGQAETGGGLIKQQIAKVVVSVNRITKEIGENRAKLLLVKNTGGVSGVEVVIEQDYSRMQFRIDPRVAALIRDGKLEEAKTACIGKPREQ